MADSARAKVARFIVESGGVVNLIDLATFVEHEGISLEKMAEIEAALVKEGHILVGEYVHVAWAYLESVIDEAGFMHNREEPFRVVDVSVATNMPIGILQQFFQKREGYDLLEDGFWRSRCRNGPFSTVTPGGTVISGIGPHILEPE